MKPAIIFDNPIIYDKVQNDLLLSTLLKNVGIDYDECSIVYAVKTHVTKATKEIAESNHDQLINELINLNPSKILALGAISLSVLRGEKVTIGKERGLAEMTRLGNREVFTISSYPMWQVWKNPGLFRDVRDDITKFAEHDRPVAKPEVDIWLPETTEELKTALEWIAQFSEISIDIETTGLSPYGDTMTAIGFGVCEVFKDFYNNGQYGKAVIIPVELIYNDQTKSLVKDFLTGKTYKGKLVFHNALFDLQFLTYYTETSLLDANIDDTILMSYLVDERGIGDETGRGVSPHGLKTLSRVFFDQKDYHFNFKEWLAKAPEERDYDSLYNYLALDLIYTAQLYYLLSDMINSEDKDLWNVYNRLLIPGTKTFAEVTLQGAPVDTNYLKKLDQEYNYVIRKSRQKIKCLLRDAGAPRDLYANFKVGSTKQIARALYEVLGVPKIKIKGKKKNKTGVYVDKDTLVALQKMYPNTNKFDFINLIIENRIASKLRNTYVLGLLESAKYDGYAHGSFRVIGTVTGRLSSANPNMQNIPSRGDGAKKIKKAFIAPEGYTFVGLDLSQAEWRVIGHLSQEPKLFEIYENDLDMHKYVASIIFDKPIEEVTDDERYVAKQIGFSLLYGKTIKGLSETLTLKLGKEWTVEKVDSVLKKFLNEFSELAKWMQERHDEARTDKRTKHGIGRIRRYPFLTPKNIDEVLRFAVNTPPQGIASDLTFNAAIEFHPYIKSIGGSIVFVVHDAIYYLVPDEYLNESIEIVYDKLVNNSLMKLDVPLKSDVKVGRNWAEIKDYV